MLNVNHQITGLSFFCADRSLMTPEYKAETETQNDKINELLALPKNDKKRLFRREQRFTSVSMFEIREGDSFA